MTTQYEFPRVGHVVDPGSAGLPVEDAVEVVTLPYGRLLVLADPMPGAAPRSGATAVDALVRYLADARLDETLPESVRNLLFQGFIAANAAVVSARVPEGTPGMATSVVAVLVVEERAYVASAGVGRLFLVRDGQCTAVTRPATPMPEGEEPPPLPPGTVDVSVASPLGLSQDLVPDIMPTSVRFQEGDVLVLASDGLLDVVNLEDIGRISLDGPAEVAAIKLVELARQRRGEDNISVIVFQHSRIAPPTLKMQVPLPQTDGGRRRLQLAVVGGVLLILVAALLIAAPWRSSDSVKSDADAPAAPHSKSIPKEPVTDRPVVSPVAPKQEVVRAPDPAPWAEPGRPAEKPKVKKPPIPVKRTEKVEKLELEPPVPMKPQAGKKKQAESALPTSGKGGQESKEPANLAPKSQKLGKGGALTAGGAKDEAKAK
ncbi:MAG: serine/threonine-protein phosphatase, partial [Deltaproteobacteria bacterium]|nr:serine/threonine-protein phosphatase [Deltaproteobacteria bacterium]